MLTAEAGRVRFAATAIAGAGTTLFLMGMVAAAYGPLLPYLIDRFHISVDVAGLIFGFHFAGALIGVICSMVALPRFRSRRIVTIGLSLLALGCAAVALAPTWPLTLVGVFLIGVGFGQLDLATNQLLAYSVNRGRVALLNALNGIFGIGAVAAPLLIAFAADRYATLYFGGTVVALVALTGMRGLSGSLHLSDPSRGGSSSFGLITVFAVAFGLYVGIEIGVAGWMPTHLHSIGYSLASAAAITSGFWLALAIGRFAVAPFVLRLGEAVVVLLTTGASIVTLLLAILAPFAAVAYIVTGLIIAPIFPTGVAWLARLNPKNPAATSWLFPAGMVGGALIPTFAGVLVQGISPAVVPGFFAVVALTTLVSFSGAGFSSRRPRAATAGVPG